MMALIHLALSVIILGILYKRMIDREVPTRITRKQSIVPVVLGILSLLLSFLFFMAIGSVLLKIGFSGMNLPLTLRSVISAFIQAGLPEELAKMLMILLALYLFRSEIRNVYEYILIGAAVGFGFTIFEEVLYSSGAAAIIRLVNLPTHMVINMLMARHLGFAKFSRITGKGSAAKEYVLAIAIPVLIHTCYDACTSNNRFLNGADEEMLLTGIILGMLAAVGMFVLQTIILVKMKKDTEKYCDMKIN